MLGPVQHTSIPIEPIRQHVAPPQQTLAPQIAAPLAQPVEKAGDGKDQFTSKDGEKEKSEDSSHRQAQRPDVSRKMNNAWARLFELRKRVEEALASGDGKLARDAAIEAAMVATAVRDMAGSLPDAVSSTADLAAALDSARTGGFTALQVVDLAATYPHHPVQDRIAINGARIQVLDAMAGIEAVASLLVRPGGQLSGRYDFKV